jgi:spore maturation protein CgeB
VPWAQRAIRVYDCVVSPRRANMGDLSALGCRSVKYVPFGYDPRHCFPESQVDPRLSSDVLFVGGADKDRARWIAPLLSLDIRVALYGSYWDRYPETRGKSRGQAAPDVIRRATAAAKIALCLVRRANRDGHVMRSIEIPAIGACMLAEDTEEHRALFGPDGESVMYFDSPEQMLERVTWLLDRPDERARLASAAHRLVTHGKHAYVDRLAAMLDLP